MRQEFSRWAADFGRRDPRFLFLTGDLGFRALEEVAAGLGPRFINMGVAEQNMVSVAAGLAHQGLHPLCYSIAPFAVFRPFEQIRLDLALNRLPVKIVGNGGGYGYGIMGASHHALEDLAVLSCLPNFSCVIPLCGADVGEAGDALFHHEGPAYLRLGLGSWPAGLGPRPAFGPLRRLAAATSGRPDVTVAGIGPVLLNALPWAAAEGRADIFAVGTLPLENPSELLASVRASGRLLVIEEHAARGGLGEHLALLLAKEGVACRLHHRHAEGYPGGRYGSQGYHQAQSRLDPASLRAAISAIVGSS